MNHVVIIMVPDVLFVGAGPVGLFTAINAKLSNPDLQILMFERHPHYTRRHHLIIDPSSYQGSHPDPDFQALLKKLQGSILTTTIEQELRLFATKLGIQISLEHITDIAALTVRFPSAHTVVGADGAKSRVRQQMFQDTKDSEQNLQYIVEVKYLTREPTSKVCFLQTSEGLSQIHHFVREHVGKKGEEGTPVSLFFFVNRKTYEQVYAKGTMLTLKDIQRETAEMTDLANSVHPWLALRKYYLHEQLVSGSDKVAAVALTTYKSRVCAKMIDEKCYVLVGDARLGIPFFRALNAGFIGGIKAAKLIGQVPKYSSYTVASFNRDMSKLADREIARAGYTNHKVNFGRVSALLLQYSLSKPSGDIMDHGAYWAMRKARVSPLSFYTRYRFWINSFLFFIGLTLLFAFAGFLPFENILVARLTLWGASVLCSVIVTTVSSALYAGITYLIGYLRKQTTSKPEDLATYIKLEAEQDDIASACLLPPSVQSTAVPPPDTSASLAFFARRDPSPDLTDPSSAVAPSVATHGN